MPSPLTSFLRTAFNVAAGAIMLVDAVARPVYGLITEKLDRMEAVRKAEAAISKMPRPAILVTFAVPFVIAEPAKIFALFVMAQGHFLSGLFLLAIAYLVTFLVVERIYHAGKDKLLTYSWFAWAVRQLGVVRDHMKRAASDLFHSISRLLNR